MTSPNERSEAIHLAMGFTRVSTLKNVGYKDGWRDVSWFCKKFDYRYDAEPWKNSKDSVPRAINFIAGGKNS